MNTAWKFLRERDGRIVSDYDGSEWTVGEWREVPAPTETCKGLCASAHAVDAESFVRGEYVALVEYGGHVIHDDKLTCQRMRLLAVWSWQQYEAVRVEAWQQYKAVRVEARQQYDAVEAPAWQQYEAVRAEACQQYKADVDAGLLATEPLYQDAAYDAYKDSSPTPHIAKGDEK